MKKFLFIIVMILSICTVSFANTPCCNSKMNHCGTCAKSCAKSNCKDYCNKSCKSSGECDKTCK